MLTASTSALVLLLVSSCGDDQQAYEADPSAEPDTGSSPDADPDSDSGADSADEEEEEEDEESGEPIPASADGPAQNWPEPEIPDGIYEETEEGAEALLHYWWEVLNHARITGRRASLRRFLHRTASSARRTFQRPDNCTTTMTVGG
ncbi:DUF6318 family protein [Nesterenkonia pannonica]|uniref:DUF6318 family protein n=1 Tax=Nesterenkonia pannonica TaxID=1548602 RepID=UPI0021644147|nr:DUF6318 family protein [Nesterenkonia pannonica]